MLVITRKEGEAIEITIPGRAEPATIRVSKLKGERVRLALDFDRDIEIMRQEILSQPSKATA